MTNSLMIDMICIMEHLIPGNRVSCSQYLVIEH